MSLDIYDGLTIVVGDEGPPGTPAAVGASMSFSNGYHAGEVLPGDVCYHPMRVTSAASRFVSRDRPTAIVTFAINQNTVQIGTATMDPATCGAGPVYHGVVALTGGFADLADADLADWTAPGTVDATFKSGALVLAGPV